MINLINELNSRLSEIFSGVLNLSYQGAVLVVLVYIVTKLWKSGSPCFKYGLWCLVLIKFLTPIHLSLPTGAVNYLPEETYYIPYELQEKNPYHFEPLRTSVDDLQLESSSVSSASLYPWNWRSFSGLFWFLGIIFLVSSTLLRYLKIKKLLLQSGYNPPQDIVILTNNIRTRIKLNKNIKILISESVDSPLAFGILKPIVVLPESLISVLDRKELSALLAHELIHIKRKDHLMMIVEFISSIVHFFNPFVWLAVKHLKLEREKSCDDRVVSLLKGNSKHYGNGLLKVIRFQNSSRIRIPATLALSEKGCEIGIRIKRIIKPSHFIVSKISIPAFLFLLLLAFIVLPGTANKIYSYESNDKTIQNSETRILHFPANQNVGKIRTKPNILPDWHRTSPVPSVFEWKYLCEAQGDVAVPKDAEIGLELYPETFKDISFLEKLATDDLCMLSLQCSYGFEGVKPDDSCLLHIRKLSDLKELFLKNANITYKGLEYLKALKSLEILSIKLSPLNEKEINVIADLDSLNTFMLHLPNATESNLASLAKVSSFKQLEIALDYVTTGKGLEELITKNSSLDYLVICGLNLDNSKLKYLKKAPFIKRMWFVRDLPLTDEGLAHISSITQIEDLHISHSQITDRGLTCLNSMKSLKILDISWTKVTDEGLAALKNLKSLESLSVPSEITDKGLIYISELPNLKELSVHCLQVTDTGVEYISKISSLEELGIGGNGITDIGISNISKLSNLKILSISRTNPSLGDKALVYLSNLKSLTSLSLPSDSEITISGLKNLNSLTNLKDLWIKSVKQDNTVLDISKLTNLEVLTIRPKSTLSGNTYIIDSLHDDDFACLANMENLRWLQGVRGDITDEGISHLIGLKNMERINIYSPYLTDLSLSYLTNLQKLAHLTIAGNFTDNGLKYLEKNKNLYYIKIYSSNDFSPPALKSLKNNLPYLITFNAEKDREIAIQDTAANINTGISEMAPTFSVQTLDGKEIKLEDFKGKVVMLYFWATWCSPCIKSLPELNQFYKNLKNQYEDFEMIGISLDDSEAAFKLCVRRNDLQWPQVRVGLHSKVAADYSVTGAPAYFLIGPDGKIILNKDDKWINVRTEISKLLGK